MPVYQLTSGKQILRLADGAFIPPTQENADYRDYIAWVAKGNAPDAVPVPAVTKPQSIPATAFLNRFSLTAKTMLFAAAGRDPNMLQLVVTAAAAGIINLADPDVQAGVNSLVPAILTAPEAAIILDH
jgi:hypothetical protein